ncbi:hypothetical protein SSX86_018016 [Deinandra increscens subsp. villosa]|uniref:DUF674 domain-containing protein n=1 Tax=Deinandra increscens subsp. villosa TaxID=3103831 RepID=A0AAP0CWE5_9ASTR
MTNSAAMSLKLLVNKQDRKVVFAEVNKDFVDFLFYILTLPIGAITKLFAKEPLSGSLGDLYRSIENLNDMYILQNKTKETVLNPKSSTNVPGQDLLLVSEDPPTTHKKFYRCMHQCKYVTDEPKIACPNCRTIMSVEVSYASTEAAKVAAALVGEAGFVKGVVTYMVMDDLAVKPMSTISTITLLNKLSVKDVCVLEEKEVQFGIQEALKLLKASLVCKNVLTRVFLDPEDHVEII